MEVSGLELIFCLAFGQNRPLRSILHLFYNSYILHLKEVGFSPYQVFKWTFICIYPFILVIQSKLIKLVHSTICSVVIALIWRGFECFVSINNFDISYDVLIFLPFCDAFRHLTNLLCSSFQLIFKYTISCPKRSV